MLSSYLKEYFERKNISQYDIEKKTGISQSKINLSFNGKRKLSAYELIIIANVYDLDLNNIKEILRNRSK